MTYLETDLGILVPRLHNGDALAESNFGAVLAVELLEAKIADLEARLQEQGWLRLDTLGSREFTRDAQDRITEQARTAYLANPLINRAVEVGALYVFGQDLSTNAADDTVELVIDRFWRDNRSTLTGQQASRLLEVELEVTGNVFLALFADPMTGSTRVRTVPMEEMRAIVTNPEDRSDVWYYRREWNEQPVDGSTPEKKTALYPDWRYQPSERPGRIGEYEVRWGSPVLHVRAGAFPHWRWGVSEVFAALAWATAYKSLLEDDATRSRALARFAWKVSTGGGRQGVAQAKTKLATTLGANGRGGETNPAPVAGSSFIAGEGTNLDPIKIAGANLDADHSKPARLMVASGVGLPDTILSGDVDQGNLATARSLDRPTELKYSERRSMWVDVFTELAQFVIDRDQEASAGILGGRRLSDDERIVTFTFPSLLEHDIAEQVGAISTAAPHLPKDLTAKLMMQALAVEDIDAELEKLADEEEDTPEPPVPPTEEEEEESTRVEEAAKDEEITREDLEAMTAWYDQHFPATAGLLDAEIIKPKKAT